MQSLTLQRLPSPASSFRQRPVRHLPPAARALMLREPTLHPLVSGEWESSDPLSSTDDVFKFFVRGRDITELTSLWKHVEDIMQLDVICTTPQTPLPAAKAACRRHRIGGMPVVEPGSHQLVGIICLSDFRRGGLVVKDAMTRGVVAVKETDTIPAAAELMLQNDLDRLPVVDDGGRCVGIITRTDMFWALVIDNDEEECCWRASTGMA